MEISVLIVDDDALNRKIIRIMLEDRYVLREASSGQETLELLREYTPDIILLDVMMPGIDGYEVCEIIRKDSKFDATRVLFLTAKNMIEDQLQGYNLGGDDYIMKPFDEEILTAKIGVFAKLISIDRKNSELLRELEAKNDELQALAETGALVATVVHDAKKFTSAMSMSLEGLVIPLLEEKLVQSEGWVMELMNDVIEVHSNSIQCTGFLESLLAINRKNETIEKVSVVDIVQQAIGLLSYNLIQEKIQWALEFESGLKMMAMGNSQLIRVFMNLIANACDALKRNEIKDPKITITIVEADDTIQVSVHDNGPGIKPEILESIRKGIVITTKGKGGNGFGVSGATKIVKTVGGKLTIFSEVGKGATFIVTLTKASVDERQEEFDMSGIDLF
jgi:two-component system sensor histidine kinase/response regulator